MVGLPAYLGATVPAGLKEDGAGRVGAAKLRPARVDDCCPVATGRLTPPAGLIPGRAPGVTVPAGLIEDGAERAGEAKLLPVMIDGCCPVPDATGLMAPPDGLIAGRAPPFCPIPGVVVCAFAAYVEDLNTVLPPGDAATPAKVLAVPPLERFAVLVPARFAGSCGLIDAAPETERLAGEAANPPFGFPPDPATEEPATLQGCPPPPF